MGSETEWNAKTNVHVLPGGIKMAFVPASGGRKVHQVVAEVVRLGIDAWLREGDSGGNRL